MQLTSSCQISQRKQYIVNSGGRIRRTESGSFRESNERVCFDFHRH